VTENCAAPALPILSLNENRDYFQIGEVQRVSFGSVTLAASRDLFHSGAYSVHFGSSAVEQSMLSSMLFRN